MDLRRCVRIRLWYPVWVLLTLSVSGNVKNAGTHENMPFVDSCLGLSRAGLEICSLVELGNRFVRDGVDCRMEDCKATCCANVRECIKSNYMTGSRIDCVYSKLREHRGPCCTIKGGKIDKTKLLYVSGGFGVAVISAGLYLLSTSRSKRLEPSDSSDFEDPESFLGDANGHPHLRVDEILATDGADPFWD